MPRCRAMRSRAAGTQRLFSYRALAVAAATAPEMLLERSRSICWRMAASPSGLAVRAAGVTVAGAAVVELERDGGAGVGVGGAGGGGGAGGTVAGAVTGDLTTLGDRSNAFVAQSIGGGGGNGGLNVAGAVSLSDDKTG